MSKDFVKAKKLTDVSIGESVQIMRKLQEFSQSELAGIPQSTISTIENDRVGLERAKTLARALRCHPDVLVFPSWDTETEAA